MEKKYLAVIKSVSVFAIVILTVALVYFFTREKYDKFLDQDKCGKSQTRVRRVVGGQQATFGKHPWLVQFKPKTKDQNCAGSIISKDWVLTAAHCLYKDLPNSYEKYKKHELEVIVGQYDYEKQSDDQQSKQIKKIIIYGNYDHDDIALLQLEKSLDFSNYVRPICLKQCKREFRAVLPHFPWHFP